MKTYQKLRTKNLKAAKLIYQILKDDKAISHESLSQIYVNSTGARRHGSFNKLIETTIQFMYDHELMSREKINGLIVYVATQKCWRTKNFENATRVYQVITNEQIDRAIKLQELNAGMVPVELEGKVIANILDLEGVVVKYFIDMYVHAHLATPTYLAKKYLVVGPVQALINAGFCKKV